MREEVLLGGSRASAKQLLSELDGKISGFNLADDPTFEAVEHRLRTRFFRAGGVLIQGSVLQT